MRKEFLQLMTLMMFLWILTGCPGKQQTEIAPETGYVTGKVVDYRSNPLPRVEIVIDNTYLYNSNLVGTTDQDGNYKIKLPNVAATYQAYAKIRKSFNGKQYQMDLHPSSAEGFTQTGAVRNFQWKLTGKKPAPLSGNYGGFIQINKAIGSTLFDVENIEFTLTPVGNLIDGSEGQVLRMKSGLPRTDTYSQLVDIPIGRYRVSGVHKTSSGEKIVKLRNNLAQNNSFENSVLLDFEPQTPNCFNCCSIEYTE